MIPAFERAKTVHDLDRADTVIGNYEALDSIKGEGCVDLLCTLEISSSISNKDSYSY
jgi:hypothetical protein